MQMAINNVYIFMRFKFLVNTAAVPGAGMKWRKKRFLHCLGRGGVWIAEASKRFPNRLVTAAFAAPGNQFCTAISLSKGDGQLILETKIDRCKRLIVSLFR